MTKRKIEPMKRPDRMLAYWKKEKLTVAAIVVFGLAFNVAMVLSPLFQGRLIDAIVADGAWTSVATVAATFVGIVASIQVARYFKRFYVRRFANVTSVSMRRMIYNGILHRTATELEDENTGNLTTRAVADVDLCVEGMRKFTTEVFDTGVLMVAYLISLLVFDVSITLLAVAFIPVAMVLAEQLKGYIYRHSVAYRKKSGEVADFTNDIIDNSMLYRISGMEKDNRIRYEKELDDLEVKAVRANVLENAMQPVYYAITLIGAVAVIALGGRKVVDGDWTIGLFSTYMTMFVALALKASKASKTFNSVQKSQISWQRIKPYLKQYVENETTDDVRTAGARLTVTALGLDYERGRGKVIDGIGFSAGQGEIIGVTGPIASGKSTLGLALTGLYPHSGSVTIDGRELGSYNAAERSRLVSYLGHHSQLLSDTIKNNITLGDDLDVSAVLTDVCFEADLLAMPSGVETRVGNAGIRLSGGQQARIALARALIRKNKVIVLDDPFAAVDMKTEAAILANLRKGYADSVIVLISHRLAVFDKIDRIVLLNADRTSIVGTHAELMRTSPLYASIYRLQAAEGSDIHED